MGKANFSEEFKRDAVHQIVVRGYQVREVSARLDVSTHSLYAWMKKYSLPLETSNKSNADTQSEEIRRLKRELLRVTEERDILKKATAYFAKDAK